MLFVVVHNMHENMPRPPLIFTRSNFQPVVSRWVTAKQLHWVENIISYARDFDLVSFFSTICVLRSSSPDCPPHPLLITPTVSIKGRTDGWINQSEELVSVTFLLRPISTPFGPSGSSPACQAAWWHQAWPSELQERATAPGKSCDIAFPGAWWHHPILHQCCVTSLPDGTKAVWTYLIFPWENYPWQRNHLQSIQSGHIAVTNKYFDSFEPKNTRTNCNHLESESNSGYASEVQPNELLSLSVFQVPNLITFLMTWNHISPSWLVQGSLVLKLSSV